MGIRERLAEINAAKETRLTGMMAPKHATPPRAPEPPPPPEADDDGGQCPISISGDMLLRPAPGRWMLLIGCAAYRLPAAVLPIIHWEDWIYPLETRLAADHGGQAWGTMEYGKGAPLLATYAGIALESTQTGIPTGGALVVSDPTSASWRACREHVVRAATIVIQRLG